MLPTDEGAVCGGFEAILVFVAVFNIRALAALGCSIPRIVVVAKGAEYIVKMAEIERSIDIPIAAVVLECNAAREQPVIRFIRPDIIRASRLAVGYVAAVPIFIKRPVLEAPGVFAPGVVPAEIGVNPDAARYLVSCFGVEQGALRVYLSIALGLVAAELRAVIPGVFLSRHGNEGLIALP